MRRRVARFGGLRSLFRSTFQLLVSGRRRDKDKKRERGSDTVRAGETDKETQREDTFRPRLTFQVPYSFFVSHPRSESMPETVDFFSSSASHVSRHISFVSDLARRADFVVVAVLAATAVAAVDDDPPVLRSLIDWRPSLVRARNARFYAGSGPRGSPPSRRECATPRGATRSEVARDAS